jgi:hypothetical protein
LAAAYIDGLPAAACSPSNRTGEMITPQHILLKQATFSYTGVPAALQVLAMQLQQTEQRWACIQV